MSTIFVRQSTTALFTFLCSLFFLLSLPALVFAQSTAAEIETLLNTSAVSYAQAVRFVLEAADIAVMENQQEAFDYAVRQNLLPENILSGDSARLDRLSLILMRSFGIKGGLLYGIFQSPRYAYRELAFLGIIQGRADPHMAVSGERLLFYISRILSRNENQDG